MCCVKVAGYQPVDNKDWRGSWILKELLSLPVCWSGRVLLVSAHVQHRMFAVACLLAGLFAGRPRSSPAPLRLLTMPRPDNSVVPRLRASTLCLLLVARGLRHPATCCHLVAWMNTRAHTRISTRTCTMTHQLAEFLSNTAKPLTWPKILNSA